MFPPFEENFFRDPRSQVRKCGNLCTLLSATICFLTFMIFLAIFAVDLTQKIHIVYVLGASHVTNDKFLSVALDSSIIASDFKHLNLKSPKFVKLLSALSPAYLRIGGTMADRLTFTKSLHFKHSKVVYDGGVCAYEDIFCDDLDRPNFTMNANEWLHLNELAKKTNLEIIFGLNSLKRLDNGSWDSQNAEELIKFSSQHNLTLNWELGNEPNAFRHQFNYYVSPTQMAKDFQSLKNILRKYQIYEHSLLVGPDVTRPQSQNNASETYFNDFLRGASHVVDAATWHQYYFNGATARIPDFLTPDNFDLLEWQIDRILNISKNVGFTKPIWLGETASAYGGGAPHLSNRYIATFLWLDKLGLAAKKGLNVVIRQSVFQGNYALINNNYAPSPDWWISVLYKKLVSNVVVNCHFPKDEKVRLYCQCANKKRYNNQSITVFGINIGNRNAKIRFQGIMPIFEDEANKMLQVDAYVLTTVDRIDSRFIYLNDELLELTKTDDVPNLLPKTVNAYPYVEMPPYSLAFWVVPVHNVVSFC